MNSSRFGRQGLVVHHEGADIATLPRAWITDAFASAGLLLFRGFDLSRDGMQAFCEQYSARFVLDVGRSLESTGPIQLVTPGMDAIDLHVEHGNGPFRPELVWFCCQTAAASGGETTVCDGVALWNALRPTTRDLFRARRLKFGVTYPAWAWRRFLGPGATLDDVRRVAETFPGVRYSIGEDQSVRTEYIVSGVTRTKWGQQEAFANSLRGPYDHDVRFEDGEPIPADVLDEIASAAESVTDDVRWQAGDLVMLDNSRFLHGRRAFSDRSRHILVALSWSNFA